jgi:transcriptional regulator with XRE-family HTH domain
MSAPRRLVGSMLRRYREERGYTLDMSADLLGCHRSKVSRIETGARGITARDLRVLLDAYCAAADEQAALIRLVRAMESWPRGNAYRDVLSAGERDYLLMESAARRILVFDAHQIPDLLQTREYAHAIARARPCLRDTDNRNRFVEVTIARQRTLEKAESEVSILLAEGALLQRAGDTQVMRDQLGHLVKLAEASPGIGVQVVPFTQTTAAACGAGSMRILGFAATWRLGVVYLPGPSGGASLEGGDPVEASLAAFICLQRAALTRAASISLIRELADL